MKLHNMDIDHLQKYCNCEISMVWAINLHRFLHCLNHRATVVDNSGMSTTCHEEHGNCGISTVFSKTCARNWKKRQNHDLHLWNLPDMHNEDVDHTVKELQLWNVNGHLNSQDHGDLPLRINREYQRP